MEMMAATQGVDLLAPLKTTRELEKVKAQVRKVVPYFDEDAPFYEAIERMEKLTFTW
jgi:histidine ammonia-lyase